MIARQVRFRSIVFARLHTLETTPKGHDLGIELLPDLLPWLRDSDGFRGMLRLSTADREKTIVITLWVDEESMQRSSESGRRLGALAAEASESKYLAVEDYEVTFVEAHLD
jgi:heme-degrading monooxygenase HmoA